MKKILAILLSLLTLLSCGLLSACSAKKTQPDTPDTETVWETVSEAYIYAFPLVLTDATKTLSTNTDGTMTGRAPINQFNHAKKLADASFRTVVTPNVDTVYSQAWLDISTEPMVYVLPETDRFCNVQLLDAWTNTAAVLDKAPQIIEAIKSGAVKHIFLVGGCDGAHPGRNYYTDFVKSTPMDSLILTLACGKFRFNDLDLGDINGIPRILDAGQCNDAYSAIRIALALAEAFGCGVNDLPLTLVLSWYEQKAVCILLTLLYLGLRNIYLGPTLPAFVSPNVLDFLVKQYNLTPTGDPKTDLEKILNRQ